MVGEADEPGFAGGLGRGVCRAETLQGAVVEEVNGVNAGPRQVPPRTWYFILHKPNFWFLGCASSAFSFFKLLSKIISMTTRRTTMPTDSALVIAGKLGWPKR